MLTHFVYDAVLLGGTAWDVHELGLNAALRLANRANGGLSILALACYGGAGLLLLLVGWAVSVRSWRQKPPEASEPEVVAA